MAETHISEKNRKNIYLIGFMGCGKSTVAKQLQKAYGMHCVEMDEQIEQEEGMCISQIFAEKGEEYFRKLETDLLCRLQTQKNTVVSCGGGVPMREVNIQEMKKQGKIVFLSATPESIYERVKNSHNRPLLEGNMNVEYIRQLMDMRRPKYESAADLCLQTDGKNISEICCELIGKIDEII